MVKITADKKSTEAVRPLLTFYILIRFVPAMRPVGCRLRKCKEGRLERGAMPCIFALFLV